MSCMLMYPDPDDAVDMMDLTPIPSDQLEREADEMLRRATIVLPEYGIRVATSEAELERVRNAFARCGLVFYRAQGKEPAFVIPETVVEEATNLQHTAFQQRNGIVDDGDEPLELILAEMAQETNAAITEIVARRGGQLKADIAHAIAETEAA